MFPENYLLVEKSPPKTFKGVHNYPFAIYCCLIKDIMNDMESGLNDYKGDLRYEVNTCIADRPGPLTVNQPEDTEQTIQQCQFKKRNTPLALPKNIYPPYLPELQGYS